jgi:hypothetical protein
LNSYPFNGKFIEKSEYTGSIIIEFRIIKEAEEAVIALNKWSTINYAYLESEVFPA